ncbi:MAG: hypothetical protein C0448_11950 [Sphingobacteriaceae bacterium]|nr:hypothetical protein [Sphingobacteriaceae bacterium]
MKYELEIFERIIKGDLSPFADGIEKPLKYNVALKEMNTTCFNYIIASFKKHQNNLKLTDKKVVSSLHPLADKLITPQQNLFQAADIENIAPNAFKVLNIKKQNVVHVSYSRQPNKVCIYIKEHRNCNDIPNHEAKYYYYNDLLKKSSESIKLNIKKTVFEIPSEENIQQYIHNQQQAVINLCWQLMKIINPTQKKDIYKIATDFSDTEILNLTYTYLEDLIRFIEKHYLKYIDENIQIPHRSALIKVNNITEKLELVKPALLKSDIDEKLLKIIFVPFLKLSAITLEERITYKDLIYFNIYLTSFYEKANNNIEFTDDIVLGTLKEINYNSMDVFNYCIENIIKNAKTHEDVSEKINFFYHKLKLVNQRQCKTQLSFNSNLPSLKHQVIGWIEEEINYLTKKIELDTKQQQPNLFTQLDKPKLQSGLSVAQLAYFFKLQVDAGIITHKNQRDIFRHIAESYQTSKVHDISSESVGSKFYNVESSTADAVKENIIKLLNIINSKK